MESLKDTYDKIVKEEQEKIRKKYGIEVFEKIDPLHSVCSTGFSPKDQKWYGWSHRAIYGYGVGDEVEEGSIPTEYIKPIKKIKTLEDAKKVAIAFARSVS